MSDRLLTIRSNRGQSASPVDGGKTDFTHRKPSRVARADVPFAYERTRPRATGRTIRFT